MLPILCLFETHTRIQRTNNKKKVPEHLCIKQNNKLNTENEKMSKLVPVVFSGPSGVGKSTLLKKLFKEYPDAFGFSVSHTTRPPRDGEQNGIDYHFVTRETMQSEIAQNNFIEYAEFANKMYGTSKKSIKDVLESNRICILDIDEQGVKNLKKINDMACKFVFISPPSVDELRKRLNSRGTETEETLKNRMDTAISAINYSKVSGAYDSVIINDELDKAYAELRAYLQEHFPALLTNSVSGVGASGDAPHSNTTIDMNNSANKQVAIRQPSIWNYCNIL